MIIKEKRKATRSPSLDQSLIEEGSAQLSSEITILETWLANLDKLEEPEASDPATVETRNSYLDMLRSRREMLKALKEQTPSK